MNIYYTTTGEYLLLTITKQSTPTSAPVLITSGVSTSIVPVGTPKGTFTTANSAAGYSAAVDLSALATGVYDIYAKVIDPDNPARTVIRLAGTFQMD